MAANKFATMLSRNTHKLTVFLVYALLEWILIVLLLLNSLFTYSITKFASYFGLKRPCLWCSRVDHVFELQNSSNSFTDHVCETHADEISKLGYCSNHQRLAETRNMCVDCLDSQPRNPEEESFGLTQRIVFVSWIGNDADGNGGKVEKCSCCNSTLTRDLYHPFSLFKPSWDALKCAEKDSLVIPGVDEDEKEIKLKELSKFHGFSCYSEDGNDDGGVDEHQILSDVGSFGLKDCSRSESNLQFDEKESSEDQKTDCHDHVAGHDSSSIDFFHRSDDERTTECCCEEDESVEIIHLNLEKTVHGEFERLIPLDLIDSSTRTNRLCNLAEEKNDQKVTSDIGIQVCVSEAAAEEVEQNKENEIMAMIDSYTNDFVDDECEKDDHLLEPQILSAHTENIGAKELEKLQEEETMDSMLLVCKTKNSCSAEMSPPSNIHPEAQEPTPANVNNNPEAFIIYDEIDTNYKEKTIPEEKMNSDSVDQAEEEKFPETPNSSDSLLYLHKKLLLFEKRESGTEDSMDGSVISETDSTDPTLTIERLKTALKSERKALSALYTELEEERSASAISANQTMAMINRLQEEKAAMQMEALQYQRMMEEQAEYDQEALQLLNELMVKRENEKQELERELEVYRQKILEYEATENLRLIRRIKDGSQRSRISSGSCSVAEDIEELSIDLNLESKETCKKENPDEDYINLDEIALDCVQQMSALDDSLLEFEEERLSILDQLKALEEKLIALGEKEMNQDDQSIGSTSKCSPKEFDQSYNFCTLDENGVSNELLKNTENPERKYLGFMAKSLLPLLDAAENETDEGFPETENMAKVAIEDEVDHVYERLQALETDREFLKHCMSSMQNGEKGMDLLQEVLQHLRDLRSVELRVRSMNDDDDDDLQG